MFGSQVLEVLIGLVVVYLTLCFACSGIKEVIATVVSMRAKTLEAGIRNMLDSTETDLTAKLFAHPLIAASVRQGRKPSYISARAFALALFDLLDPVTPPAGRTAESLRQGLSQIPNSKVQKAIVSFLDAAQGDIGRARQMTEHWFDDTMDRVSGWYKRKAQIIIFVVGVLLCAAFNADTLVIVKELWSEEPVRTAVVTAGEKKLNDGSLAIPCKPGDSAEGISKEIKCANQIIREANSPPIGWSADPNDLRAWPRHWQGQALRVLGILFSSLAITLGTPFWFDLLNKLVNLRITGAPPEAAT